MFGFSFRRSAVLGAAVIAAACSSTPLPKPCPPNAPAFRLELTTADDVNLPADTELVVTYSSAVTPVETQSGPSRGETYSLAKGGGKNSDVCCRPGSPTTAALPHVACNTAIVPDASRTPALLCELWTDGAADVQVTAAGYRVLAEHLTAQVEDPQCANGGLSTLDVRLALAHPDGGT